MWRRIADQNEAYRKGLVLGLTMAEVGILIIFVLLLLLVFSELTRADTVRRFENKEAVSVQELGSLRDSDRALSEAKKVLGAPPESIPDDFIRLVRVLKESAEVNGASRDLEDASKTVSELRAALQEVKKSLSVAGSSGAGAVVERLEQQGFRLANQEGQVKRLQNQLVASGQGKGERPCWVQPNGTIDYLYDVVLGSDGIRMREHYYASRAAERAALPMPPTASDEVLTPVTFLARTRALFEHGLANDCRFFVVVYDATAVHEKALYKNLLRTVEGHFYKRLDTGHAPF